MRSTTLGLVKAYSEGGEPAIRTYIEETSTKKLDEGVYLNIAKKVLAGNHSELTPLIADKKYADIGLVLSKDFIKYGIPLNMSQAGFRRITNALLKLSANGG